GAEPARQPTGRDALDGRDRRRGRHHVAEVGHQHRGAEIDIGVLGESRQPDPDVLVERGGVEQPHAVVPDLLRELRVLEGPGPRGHADGELHGDPSSKVRRKYVWSTYLRRRLVEVEVEGEGWVRGRGGACRGWRPRCRRRP